jgi:phosphonate transport system substrate-binding protein
MTNRNPFFPRKRRPKLAILCFLLFLYAAEVAGEELILGVHPYLHATILMERFTPLADHLSRVLGVTVRVKVGSSYSDHIAAVGHGKVDIAFMGPAPYVLLVDRFGERPLLGRLSFNGTAHFQGVIAVSESSDIRSLGEISGKNFAFGDPESTMSALVPTYMLQQAGVEIADLDGYAHLENHHNVVLGVLLGKYDAGAMKGEVFYAYQERGLRALAWSPKISSHLFVANPALPEELVGRLRRAMQDLHKTPEGLRILDAIKKGATGLVPVQDGDYSNLREILRASGKLEQAR